MQQPTDVAVALNRFGLGARGDEPLPGDPRAWLLSQFGSYQAMPTVFDGVKTSPELIEAYATELMAAKDKDGEARTEARKALRKKVQGIYRDEVKARAQSALNAATPFLERLVYFWSNHFAVSADNPRVRLLAGAFEREAIRPHVMGRFEEMLIAVEQHPAMLIYLNQVRSAGPTANSPSGWSGAIHPGS